ncbi:MAG TPA: GntR family transcriptional regulator [Ideonella sp.]|uniref:GntR family transcriptional regulator n=1 Tax=Ideonella sp. TaxID=1929293 RepID=UPI002E32E495|nr:GntR family transcriptional regulator [Ideonella sp.]HEX5684569.1 GntR family transcriptional regulator [Ideonella sp.]
MSAVRMPRASTAEHIARVLRDRIICGEIPADRALRQDQVAQEFDSSHVPVREAFQRLQSQGLVVTLPRRGVRVAPLDLASIREAVEIRAALEGLALRSAAPQMTERDVAALEAAQRQCNSAESLEAWDAANRAFHFALVAPCGMPRLLSMLDSLQLANSRVVFAAGRTTGWRPRSNHDHQLIIDALKAGDTVRATSLLNRHIGTMERVGFPTVEKLGDAAARP